MKFIKLALSLSFLGLSYLSSAYDFSELSNIKSHPRFILTKERVAEIKSYNETDSFFQLYLNNLILDADTGTNTNIYNGTSVVYANVLRIATAYRLTNDSKYSDWVEQQLLSLARLDTWYTTQFLDTAILGQTICLAYDWIYDALNDTVREEIETAITHNFVDAGLGVTIADNWSYHTNNWALICDGSLLLGALTVIDSNRLKAEDLLDFVLPKLELSLQALAPDGGWYEGYSYALYGFSYLGLVLSGIDTAIGYDWGLGLTSGLDEINAWMAMLLGYNFNIFGWGDGTSQFTATGELWTIAYLDQKSGESGKKRYLKTLLERYSLARLSSDYRGALWYYPPTETLQDYSRLFVGNNTQTVTYRTSWSDSDNPWFLALRAGNNGLSHGHLDSGSFMLETDGYNWTETLGSETYSVAGYWDDMQRWNYYRTQTQGANTLAISDKRQNNLEFENQVINANNSLVSSGITTDGFYAVVNLSESYSHADSVLRGIKLSGKNQMILRDEIKAARPLDSLTSWHTRAKITLLSTRLARLEFNGTYLYVNIDLPESAEFEVVTANPCTGISSCVQTPNTGISNLVVRNPNLMNSSTIQVSAYKDNASYFFEEAALEDWKLLCTKECKTYKQDIDFYWLKNIETYY